MVNIGEFCMRKTYNVGLESMKDVARDILMLAPEAKIITFSGSLGAGKTTLVQQLLGALGVTEPITSPTYTYVNRYKLPMGKVIYHFDLYRLRSAEDFIRAGFDEYVYHEHAVCLIEWPEIISEILPKETCYVALEYRMASGDLERTITIEY